MAASYESSKFRKPECQAHVMAVHSIQPGRYNECVVGGDSTILAMKPKERSVRSCVGVACRILIGPQQNAHTYVLTPCTIYCNNHPTLILSLLSMKGGRSSKIVKRTARFTR